MQYFFLPLYLSFCNMLSRFIQIARFPSRLWLNIIGLIHNVLQITSVCSHALGSDLHNLFFPPRLSVVQGPSLVLCVNLHLCAHICVILILREIARINIGTQPKLTHSHTCFISGGNEETMWYVLKHWSKNMTQDSRELLEQLWRGRIQSRSHQEPEV